MSKNRLLFLLPDTSLTHLVFLPAYRKEIAPLTGATFNPTAEQYSDTGLIELIPDEQALIQYLQAGRFRAALNPYAEEPLARGSPLPELSNVICLPYQDGQGSAWQSKGFSGRQTAAQPAFTIKMSH